MSALLRNPDVLSALIAGAVSLLIAIVSGIWVLRVANRRMEEVRAEIVGKRQAERILENAQAYLTSFREFERRAVELSGRPDGTDLVQLTVDFHANTALPFYQRNQSFLQTAALDSLLAKIDSMHQSESINDPTHPDRIETITALWENLRAFAISLRDAALKF